MHSLALSYLKVHTWHGKTWRLCVHENRVLCTCRCTLANMFVNANVHALRVYATCLRSIFVHSIFCMIMPQQYESTVTIWYEAELADSRQDFGCVCFTNESEVLVDDGSCLIWLVELFYLQFHVRAKKWLLMHSFQSLHHHLHPVSIHLPEHKVKQHGHINAHTHLTTPAFW